MAGQEDSEIRAALRTWREGLVGLTRQSRLVKFRATKTSSLLIDSPDPDAVLQALRSGDPHPFRGDPVSIVEDPVPADDEERAEEPLLGDAFHSPRPDNEIGPVVRNLMRRATAEFLDRGLSVLYVAFGMLDWRDEDGTAMVSPVLLVPVQLLPDGPRATPRITLGEDDPVVNPALALRLRDFGIDLPVVESIDDLSVSATLAAVRGALEQQPDFGNWTLRDTTYLAMFSFAKEAMYRDLQDNEARILDHPIVRALATSDPSKQSTRFQFDPIDPARIDELAPPESTPLVLDADSSQRVAIAAALDGKTFVMDGPPGTGKSQTIANMIGALLHAGKTVLFVSEKIAALDVVRNRLAATGLGSYLLELHSHKTSRREVAAELLRTLDNTVKPPAGMAPLSLRTARSRREQLSEYAVAMNELRHPLNMSLHRVLGIYAELTDAPAAPVPDVSLAALAEEDYLQLQDELQRLVRAWRPAAQGSSYLWREVIDTDSLEIRLYQAAGALEELQGTVALNGEVTAAFGFTRPSDAARLADIVEHQHDSRPAGVRDEWLTIDSMLSVQLLRAQLGEQTQELAAAEREVVGAVSVDSTALPRRGALPELLSVDVGSPGALSLDGMTAAELRATAERFERDATMLRSHLSALSGLAASLGLPSVTTFADADRIARLVELRSSDVRPERTWFTATGLSDARASAAALRDRVDALESAETRASAVFTPDALRAPIADLQDRFANLHKGLKKLSGNYRADKKSLAEVLHTAVDVKVGISHLSDAIVWADSARALESATIEHAEMLGARWIGRSTDFEALRKSFGIVDEVFSLVDGSPSRQLVAYFSGDTPNEAFAAVVESAVADFDAWRSGLSAAHAHAARPELAVSTIDDAAGWLEAHVVPMRRAASRIEPVTVATGLDHTLADIERVLALGFRAHDARDRLNAEEPRYRTAFGEDFHVRDVDLDGLDEAIAWAERLRALAGGPLTLAQVEVLRRSRVTSKLRSAYEAWTDARDLIVQAFADGRRRELSDEFDDYRDAMELIGDLRSDTIGRQEWFDYTSARSALAARGLDPAVDFCVAQHVSAHDVAAVVNRALLRGWLDELLRHDGRLRPLLTTEREALVDEFRRLDHDLIDAATGEIITAANARRPVNTAIGEPAVIRREGTKQKRHKSVRELMALTRVATPSIKPVFMMSPLAVSQYLPSDIEFDVVIFDEASQVTPGDAINCIYRGRSLVLAGDDKQLPPTSFFDRAVDDDEDDETDVADFLSVLELAKAAGSFNNLGLRWHYRSRHEDLIAFSNYKFYEGKLTTFPSALEEGRDIGVEFFNAHGMYRRGGGAFNPEEAAAVAARVMEHFTHHPELTLGVVTFSVAQADAVQTAIDAARVEHPEFEQFFDTEDRLDGFFIRALEQVQGDERDVIIFSIGYGPDEAGKISTNFGAINKDKGWRRLNVAITRARQRVEVVASMRAAQIPPSANENVEYLRSYLEYAEQGSRVLAVPVSSTGLDPESPFEESVLRTMQGWGYTVEPQVGAAGYRIDLGVRHPALPGAFAIGIECDGYQYHSAPAARDRDRLRDQILNGLGWRLHRIWGTSWYRDRETEEARLRKAIEDAILAPPLSRPKDTPRRGHPLVEFQQAAEPEAPTWTSEYVTAPAQALPRWADPSDEDQYFHMIEPIEVLVEHEGPIHIQLVHERLRDWWSVGRVGSKIRANIELAIADSEVGRDGDFLVHASGRVSKVRVPGAVVARKVEHVHLGELALAVVHTVRDVGAVPREEVVPSIARIFGWARTGAIVGQRVNDAIDLLVGRDLVTEQNGTLTVPRSD